MITDFPNDDLPPAIRRRLGLRSSADEQLEEIKRAGFRRLREYQALVLDASAGELFDPEELHDAAARVGRGPHRVLVDVQMARAAYLAWQNIFDPV
jgi:hypothetical protein